MLKGQFSAVLRRARQVLGDGPIEGPDADLLDRFLSAGDADAFTQLVERHGPMVHGVARRLLNDAHEADDVFQAAFLVLARRAHRIRHGESLASWLFGVTTRLALKARGQVARRRVKEREAGSIAPRETTAFTWDDVRPVLDEEIGRLPEPYRRTVVLRYLEGKSTEQADLKQLEESDFHTIKPGDTWVFEQSFPAPFTAWALANGSHDEYTVRKPGELSVKFNYAFNFGKDFPGCWQGRAGSNELLLKVGPAK